MRVGIDALLDQGVSIFFAQIDALDAFALKTGLRLIQAEIDEMPSSYRLLESVEECRRLVRAVENAEGVAVDEIRRRRR